MKLINFKYFPLFYLLSLGSLFATDYDGHKKLDQQTVFRHRDSHGEDALFNMRRVYRDIEGFLVSKSKTISLFKLFSDKEIAHAQTSPRKLCFNGYGVAINKSERGDDQEWLEAKHSPIYGQGEDSPVNQSNASKIFRLAVDQLNGDVQKPLSEIKISWL